jgi:nicotinamidase-related amidase
MKTALIIIDIQNDYFPGGNVEVEGAVAASLQARKALDHFRTKGLPVIHIQHLSVRPGATFLLPGTEGSEIHANVRPEPGESVFQKYYPNSFRDTPLLDDLRQLGIERLIICGMMTHMCVDSTTRSAFDHGFQCVLLADACATRSLTHAGTKVPAPHVHAAFVAALSAVFAKVMTVEDFLTQES